MKERLPFRYINRTLIPADNRVSSLMAAFKFSRGDLVFVDIKKPRNPRFNRFCHYLGILITQNVEAFSHMQPHECLKVLQLQANAGCDAFKVGDGIYTVPRSLSFGSMDEAEFSQVMGKICEYVAREYWPDMTADEIADMAEGYVDAA